MADVEKVMADLKEKFGPGFSNGVITILAHDNLPEVFGKEEWAKWTFRPADKAFEVAHDMGLIVPCELGGKWTMTDLGKRCSTHVNAELGE